MSEAVKAKGQPAVPEALMLDIANRHFFIETLDTRNRNRLDFHNVAVWSIRAAPAEAFEAGHRAAETTQNQF